MMKIVVSQPTVTILSKASKQGVGLERFPVNRIYCIGRNYREHAIEMGHDPDREPPFFFQKPADAIVDTYTNDSPCKIPYPPMTTSLHHEAELVVAIGKGGLRISEQNAMDHVFGYAIGCDLTRRDLQAEAKKMSRPWATAKGFDNSAPCGPIISKEDAVDVASAECPISLNVNGDVRQKSTLDKMVWSIPEMISYLSQYFRLQPGDLLMTGTPEGVGPIEIGDSISVSCGDLPPCDFILGEAETS